MISLADGKLLNKMTKAPARYTVSSVIDVMEKNNIGTSATRAEIIKKLLNPTRQFVRLEKNKYYATDLGRAYIKIVPEDLKDVKLTERFEESLAKIEAGEISKDVFLQELLSDLKITLQSFHRRQRIVLSRSEQLLEIVLNVANRYMEIVRHMVAVAIRKAVIL